MTGIGTALVLLILLAAILIHGFWKDELYFDTVHWEITEKSSAKKAAEQLENTPTNKYNISWRDINHLRDKQRKRLL
jgi:hypothetical protein